MNKDRALYSDWSGYSYRFLHATKKAHVRDYAQVLQKSDRSFVRSTKRKAHLRRMQPRSDDLAIMLRGKVPFRRSCHEKDTACTTGGKPQKVRHLEA